MNVKLRSFQQSLVQVVVYQGIPLQPDVSQLQPDRCVHHYDQVVVIRLGFIRTPAPMILASGLSCAAQVVHGRDCSAEGPGQGKRTAYGVGIGIAVTEVENVGIPADMGAKLGLANAHGTVGGLRIDIGCPEKRAKIGSSSYQVGKGMVDSFMSFGSVP